MNKLVSALHDSTHLIPGMPAHSETPATQRLNRLRVARVHHRGPHVQHPRRHHQNPPRLLVTWQTWIGHLVGRGKRE